TAGFVEKCRRERKLFGGAMRQVGIIAAAGLYAVQNNIERLAEDHENARLLAEGLNALPLFNIEMDRVQTNIVIVNITNENTSVEILEKMKEVAVWAVPFGPKKIRFVAHLDVSREDCREALERLKNLFG
ncbi:MAG: hypothetical protein JXA92_09995, partial [candidate division Zixibacteria bacterium]|nr:hypothetical protein [candidate division Zixibacteria bacterium]